jgi:hypothetical protein
VIASPRFDPANHRAAGPPRRFADGADYPAATDAAAVERCAAWIVSARGSHIAILRSRPRRESVMLYTIAVILLVLWVLGLVTGYTIGAFIHVLLVIAVVLLLVGLVTGRRVV